MSKSAGDRIAAFVHFLAVFERATIALLARIDHAVSAGYEVLQLVWPIEQAETVAVLENRMVLGHTAIRELYRLGTVFAQYVPVHHAAPERRALALCNWRSGKKAAASVREINFGDRKIFVGSINWLAIIRFAQLAFVGQIRLTPDVKPG